jgi:2,4'-dihydroxyacetophenone dioxygenase
MKKTQRRIKEILIGKLDPKGWVTLERTGGIRLYKLWEDPKTGASSCLLDVPKGAGVPIRHRHASNQFMYCIKGEYEYTNPGLLLKPGSFYMNPVGNPHGPTVARSRCLLLEMYDGPHYFERPSFLTDAQVGRIADKAATKRAATKNRAVKPKRSTSRAVRKRAG